MTEEEQQQAELEQLANQAAQEEKTDAIEGEWQPSQEDNAAEPMRLSTADMLAPILKISFGLVASVKGDHWRIDDEVATEAAAEYARCIDYYFPEMNTAPWVGAAMTTGMILAPRIMMDNQIAAQKAQAEQEGAATETGVKDAD